MSETAETMTEEKIDKRPGRRLVKHCLWIDRGQIILDGRSAGAKLFKRMKQGLIDHMGGKVSFAEEVFIESLAYDMLKKRLYDVGIINHETFGSRDHSLALGNSIDRRLIQLGLKKVTRVQDLDSYLREKREAKVAASDRSPV